MTATQRRKKISCSPFVKIRLCLKRQRTLAVFSPKREGVGVTLPKCLAVGADFLNDGAAGAQPLARG